MGRRISTRKSAGARAAEANALHATITVQVKKLRESDAWTAFCRMASALHRYSFNNLMLIVAANPTATRVAGYRTWQSLGRQVRKGEHGIRIFGGRETVTTEIDEETGEETERHGRRFFPVSVFDISQTDSIDPAAADADELVHHLTGGDPAGILGAVTDYLTDAGWAVTRAHLDGDTNGYTATDGTRRVVIAEDLADAQAAKTAIHETAHTLLHADESHAEYISHRGIKETEAESVAYITAGILGLDTSAYSIGYIAGWADADTDLIAQTATRVLATVRTITNAITTDRDEQNAAA